MVISIENLNDREGQPANTYSIHLGSLYVIIRAYFEALYKWELGYTLNAWSQRKIILVYVFTDFLPLSII